VNQTRHVRRRRTTTSKTFADLAMEWPTISADRVAQHRGAVVHMVVRHEYWCQTLHVGGGMLECGCSPTVSYHIAPTIQ
jgi:hypothetical protein